MRDGNRFMITGMLAAAILSLAACGRKQDVQGKETGQTVPAGMEAAVEDEVPMEEKTPVKSEQAAYVKLKPEEAKARIEDNEDIIILDVRTLEEYRVSHLGRAINIPVEDIGSTLPEALPDQDSEILVYCRSGVRSKKASKKLLKLGYTGIKDIGGIMDWPYETVAGDQE